MDLDADTWIVGDVRGFPMRLANDCELLDT